MSDRDDDPRNEASVLRSIRFYFHFDGYGLRGLFFQSNRTKGEERRKLLSRSPSSFFLPELSIQFPRREEIGKAQKRWILTARSGSAMRHIPKCSTIQQCVEVYANALFSYIQARCTRRESPHTKLGSFSQEVSLPFLSSAGEIKVP